MCPQSCIDCSFSQTLRTFFCSECRIGYYRTPDGQCVHSCLSPYEIQFWSQEYLSSNNYSYSCRVCNASCVICQSDNICSIDKSDLVDYQQLRFCGNDSYFSELGLACLCYDRNKIFSNKSCYDVYDMPDVQHCGVGNFNNENQSEI